MVRVQYTARRDAPVRLCAMSMRWGGSASSWSCTPPRMPSRRSSPRPGAWASMWASTSRLSWRRTAARSSIAPGTGRGIPGSSTSTIPTGAADAIAARAAADPDAPVRAVLPVGGEGPARVAALAARRIGLDGRDPDAVAAVGNKLRLREMCAGGARAMRWRCRASSRRGSTSRRPKSQRASPPMSAGPACSSRCCCRPAAA